MDLKRCCVHFKQKIHFNIEFQYEFVLRNLYLNIYIYSSNNLRQWTNNEDMFEKTDELHSPKKNNLKMTSIILLCVLR